MRAKKRFALQKMIFISMFTAITAILSQTQLPTPSGVPFTLQTFAIALCGYILGVKSGLTSVGLYIALGAVGLPVFSGFRGGFPILFSLTGGFIFGFIGMVILCGIGAGFRQKWLRLPFGFAGILTCHLFGVAHYALLSGNSFLSSFLLVSLPYLLKDGLSLVLAAAIGTAVTSALSKYAKASDFILP